MLILIAVASNAQVFQTNNQPYKFRGLKAADLLIAPKGCDTAALSNPKWGESTAGALFVDTCNNQLYFYNGLKWNQVTGGGGGVDSFYYNFRNLNDTTLLWDRGDGTVDTLAFSSGGTSLIGSYVDSVTTVGDTLFYWKGGNSTFVTNIATAAAGGDTTIFEIVLDSTGQPNRRVLFSETGNKIGSDNTFLWDKVNNKLVINGTNVSIGGPTAKLVVVGRAVFGVVNTDALQVQALTEVTDTSTYKPMVVDAVGITYKMNRWPSGSDTTGLGSLYIRNQFAAQENKKFSVIQGKVDALDFNATSSIADSTQRLTWDDGNGTLNIGLKGGQVNLAVGQEQVARVYNDAGVTLNDGDIVYITGAQGNRIKVQKAVNTDAGIAYATLGMVTEPITAGSEGFVTILGTVNHLNTSSFTEGTELYLSGTAGGYTSTKPTYPAAIVSIGRVERSHATVGSIYVNVRPELPTVASYGKNAGGDSTILLLSNGQRFAAKDSTGGGGMTNPMTTTGDLIYSSDNSGTPARLGIGSTGQVLTVSGGVPTWSGTTSAIRSVSTHYVGFNSGNGSTGTSGGSGTDNFFMGSGAGNAINNGSNNFIAGTNAGNNLTTGSSNVAIGTEAFRYGTTGSGNFALGNGALKGIFGTALTGSNNVAIGTNALAILRGTMGNNIAIGSQALAVATDNFQGSNWPSVAIGAQALVGQTSGGINVAVGTSAGTQMTTGQRNTFVGAAAGWSFNTGSYNTAIGMDAAFTGVTVSGSNNTIIGARNSNAISGSASDNVGIGYFVNFPTNSGSSQFVLGSNQIRWMISDVSGSSRRWTINGTTSDITATEASAALEVRSTSGGLLVPRMTATQASAIGTPADGNILYVTDTNATFTSVGFWGRENGAWVKL